MSEFDNFTFHMCMRHMSSEGLFYMQRLSSWSYFGRLSMLN